VNVPGVGKARVKEAFWPRLPESHESSSAVHVWGAPSWFVAVTLVPGAMFSAGGENVKLRMAIAAVPGGGGGGGAAVVVVVGAGADVGGGALDGGC
jgi:hypothetical protein